MFNPFSLDGASAVARMACGAGIDRRTTVGVVQSRHAACSRVCGSRRQSRRCQSSCRHLRCCHADIVSIMLERGGTFSAAVGLGQSRIDDERVAVLHHQIAAMLRRCAGRWSDQPAATAGTAGPSGLGGRGKRECGNSWRCLRRHGSRATYSAPQERRRGLLPEGWLSASSLVGTKTRHAGPDFDQRRRRRKAPLAQLADLLAQVENAGKATWPRYHQSSSATARGTAEGTVASPQAGSSVEQPNERSGTTDCSRAFHQLPFRSHRVERLKQQRSQQSSPAGSTAVPRAHESAVERRQNTSAPCQPVRGLRPQGTIHGSCL